jgi:hypothetical protein
MSRRLGRLEADLASLRKAVALKSDVSLLQDGIDLPLTQLSRTMRRYEKKEEHLRMSAEDKFSLVESRLEDLLREVAINAELIEEERRQRQRIVSLPVSIFRALKYALGQGDSAGSHRDYLYDTSTRSLPMSAPLHLTAAGNADIAAASGAKVMTSSSSKAINDNSPQHSSFSSDSSPEYASPIRPTYGSAFPSAPPPSSKLGWTEEGLAYWVFLPINVPKTVIRSAFSFANGRVNDAQNYANLASNGAVAAVANGERQTRLGPAAPTPAKMRYKPVNAAEASIPRSKDPAYRRRG